MALPVSISTCTVAGTYVDLLGNPVSGSISFKAQVLVKEKTLKVIIVNTAMTVTFDASGHFSILLPCTDDVDEVPAGFVYVVTENITGGRQFGISLPTTVAGTTQDMADLLPAVLISVSGSYITLVQYTSLLARYNSAEAIRLIVVGQVATVASTLAARDATLAYANLIINSQAMPLMMMGL